MKVFEIGPDAGHNRCNEKEAKAVLVWLEEAEVGDVITIRIKEMTAEDYSALPEFLGP